MDDMALSGETLLMLTRINNESKMEKNTIEKNKNNVTVSHDCSQIYVVPY